MKNMELGEEAVTAVDNTDDSTAADAQSKAMREVKATRHLYELELHSTMQVTNQISVMRVQGGWIYYKGDVWSEFVPEKR